MKAFEHPLLTMQPRQPAQAEVSDVVGRPDHQRPGDAPPAVGGIDPHVDDEPAGGAGVLGHGRHGVHEHRDQPDERALDLGQPGAHRARCGGLTSGDLLAGDVHHAGGTGLVHVGEPLFAELVDRLKREYVQACREFAERMPVEALSASKAAAE